MAYHYMLNDDYGSLVESLTDLGPGLEDIVTSLATAGILPGELQPYIEGNTQGLPVVRFIDGATPTPAPDFVSVYEDLRPQIAETLSHFIVEFGAPGAVEAQERARAFRAARD